MKASKIKFNNPIIDIDDKLELGKEIIKEVTIVLSSIFREIDKYFYSKSNEELKHAKVEEIEEFLMPWYRIAIKTIFSAIDALCFRIKKKILNEYERRGESIPKETKKYLQEFEIDEKGKKVKKFKRQEENIEFTLKELYKLYGKKFEKDSGLNNLSESIKIRNNITHPKSSSDLVVRFKDFERATNAYSWFSDKCNKGLRD